MTFVFARFDLQTWTLHRQALLPLAFIAVIAVILPVPGIAIIGASLVTSLVLSTAFLGDERGRLDTLYGILPVSRRSVVIGRTLSLLAYYLLAALIATVVTFVVAAVRSEAISFDLLLLLHAVALAIVGLSFSLQLPVFFRIGYARARYMAYAPSATLAAIAWLAQATGALDGLSDFESFPVSTIGVIAAGVGIIGIAIGAAAAAAAYRRRSL
ncbi:ABC-2 transporter permease [Microbacterium sp. SA39]|uniref:ABC-2 transporter permease n=1 Tax=Microbacterium sp. SA39 TaxID=1263625 RepID=UPI0005FA6D75|nr:ABC-2 transporter permease [Microbacterium sp. SA39]KJQ52731.1 hypothetical protein RS85_03625 [Microbacterium sp. SA39]